MIKFVKHHFNQFIIGFKEGFAKGYHDAYSK